MTTRSRDVSQETLERLLAEISASKEAILASEARIAAATDLLAQWVEDTPRAPEPPAFLPPEPEIKLEAPAPRALRMDAAQEDYLHVISHDLKEPLRGITYFGQLLAEDYADRLDDDGREHLDYILAATRRMNRLLEDILALSRLQRRPLNISRVDLDQLFRGVVDELRGPLEEKRGVVDFKGRLPTVPGDIGRLRDAFWHLIKNAITYSEAPVRIEVSVEAREGMYQFRVKDNGMGIEAQFQEQIFGLFQRLHSWEVYEGTGAGLTLARLIFSLHGGRIWLESTPKVGSTFIFALPIDGLPVEALPLPEE